MFSRDRHRTAVSQDHPGSSHLRITDAPSLQSSIWRLIVDLNLIGIVDIYVQTLKINLHQEALAALTLGDMQLRSRLLNAGTATRGA